MSTKSRMSTFQRTRRKKGADGEVTEEVHQFTRKAKVKQYVMFFTSKEALDIKWRLTGQIESKLLDLVCRDCLFNENYVDVSPYLRAEWEKELGVAAEQFTRAKNGLVKAGAITVTKSRYFINPLLFWKGESKVLEQRLKELEEAKKPKPDGEEDIQNFENESK